MSYLLSPSLPSVDPAEIPEDVADAELSTGRSISAFFTHRDANSSVVLGRAADSSLKNDNKMDEMPSNEMVLVLNEY